MKYTVSMAQSDYDEDMIYRKLSHVKTLMEDGKLSEKELVEQVGSVIETILGDNWWEVAGRISRSKTMFGTGYKARFDLVQNNTDLQTVKGKGRLLLLHILHLGIMTKVLGVITTLGMYPSYTLLGTQAGSQAALALARSADSQPWTGIDLANWSWLHVTWKLPVVECHELVPASDLGVYVTLVEGMPLVTNVQAGSVAAEDDKVEVGDAITHINTECVIGMNSTDKICKLLNKGKGKPIIIKVTKCFEHEKQEIFQPLVPLLKRINIDVEELQRKYFFTKRGKCMRKKEDVDEVFNPLEDDDEDMQNIRPGFTCLYLGSVNVGPCGDVDRIEFGMKKVMTLSPAGDGHPSVLQLHDIDLKLVRLSSSELVFKFTYPQIASCGRLVSKPNYFAFITAPCPDSCHSGYMCHVFYGPRVEQVKDLLSHISDGFQRTSFTV